VGGDGPSTGWSNQQHGEGMAIEGEERVGASQSLGGALLLLPMGCSTPPMTAQIPTQVAERIGCEQQNIIYHPVSHPMVEYRGAGTCPAAHGWPFN